MKSLNIEGLQLKIEEKGSFVYIIWEGRSRQMNPGQFLDPYFDKVLENLKGKELIIDFTRLFTMNSSTVPPILTFIKNLETNNIKTDILYDGNATWQKASFLPLASITHNYKFISVKPK